MGNTLTYRCGGSAGLARGVSDASATGFPFHPPLDRRQAADTCCAAIIAPSKAATRARAGCYNARPFHSPRIGFPPHHQ